MRGATSIRSLSVGGRARAFAFGTFATLVAWVTLAGCDAELRDDEPAAEELAPGAVGASSVTAPPTLEQTGRELLRTMHEADHAAFAILAGPPGGRGVRVEIRQVLVETDERETERVTPEDSAAWLRTMVAGWSCETEGCRWPGGLRTEEPMACFGDCCELPGGRAVEEGTLSLRRACFVRREGRERRLSLLAFAEAR